MKTSKRTATTLLCRLLAFALAAAALFPAISEAAVSKEDPTVTAQMRDKMSTLRKAYTLGDSKAYISALIPLLRDAVKQSPGDLVKRYASLEVIVKEGLDGYQPMIYRYAKSIFQHSSKIDAKTIDELRASLPLAQSMLDSPLRTPCGHVVVDALHGDFPEVDDIEGLSCLGSDEVVQGYTLSTAGISLPAHDACELLPNTLVYKLNIPASIPNASITSVEVVDLPFPLVLRWYADYQHWTWASVSPVQSPDSLPADAQTETFTVRVATTTGVTNLPVTFPINRGIQYACASTTVEVGIGNNWNWPFYGNGPRGPRVWTATPASGSSGLPAGLSLIQGTGSLAGDGVVAGTVQTSAINGTVDIAYTQSSTVTTKRFLFEVKLRPEPVRAAELAATQMISRGQTVSIRLPGGQGANGTYSWGVSPGYTLPSGLSVTHGSGGWFVSGIVDSHATLDVHTSRLFITSAGQIAYLNVTFDSRRPVSVYTQNMILFPPDIVNPWLDCSPALAGGPWAYGACTALFQVIDATIYNTGINSHGIHNTNSDNYERAGILIDHVNIDDAGVDRGRYDIVALQEVWDGPQTDAELEHIMQGTSAHYRALPGAAAEIGFIPPRFKINSGLLTLVKPIANQPSPADHIDIYDNAGGDVDQFANKGFVVTQMFVSDDPSEFVWVVNTHAHASEANTRADQMRELQTYVGNLPDTNPVLLLGDLNIASDEGATPDPMSEYVAMRNTFVGFQDLALRHGLITDSWDHNAYKHMWADPEPDKRIDYILLRPGRVFDLDPDSIGLVNSQPTVTYTSACLNYSPPLPSSIICHYSDHFGLKATLKFRRR